MAALIDFREREGLGGGSDGHYTYLWKHGTTGALTQPEINHAKAVRGWRRLGLQKDMVRRHHSRFQEMLAVMHHRATAPGVRWFWPL